MKDRSTRGLSLTEVKFEGNTSGWEAVDYKVFVRKDKVEEKTVGGILVPEDARRLEEWNVQYGTIVSHGDLAFTDGRRADGELYDWVPKPKVGDRVLMKEFTGQTFTGKDGETYMVFADKDIGGIET